MTKLEPLLGRHFYHIYNRGNNGETLFRNAENYRYFMQLFVEHIEPVATTYAFSLLPNHFHFLEYIRTDGEQRSWQETHGCQLSESSATIFRRIAPSRTCSSPTPWPSTNAIDRTGSLFQKPFKRIRVDSDRYFVALVRYIHRNPQKHGLISDFRDWPWSSYRTMLSDETAMPRTQVLGWFDGRDNFVADHLADHDEKSIVPYIVE